MVADTRFCPECGAECAVEDKFCDACGVSLPRLAGPSRPPALPTRRPPRVAVRGRRDYQALGARERSSTGKAVGIAFAVILVGVVGWFGWSQMQADAEAVETEVVRGIGPDGALRAISRRAEAALDERVAAFESAWRADDTDAVKRLFVLSKQSTFWPKMERMFERHGWGDDLPELLAIRQGGRSDHEAVMMYELEEGSFWCKWAVRGGEWCLDTMRFKDL